MSLEASNKEQSASTDTDRTGLELIRSTESVNVGFDMDHCSGDTYIAFFGRLERKLGGCKRSSLHARTERGDLGLAPWLTDLDSGFAREGRIEAATRDEGRCGDF